MDSAFQFQNSRRVQTVKLYESWKSYNPAIHELIESNVRDHPEQYLWTYKRFKRPGPDGDPYRR